MSTFCLWCCQTKLILKFPSSKTFFLFFYFIFSIILVIDCSNILATCRCIHFKTPGTFYSPNYSESNSTSPRCLIYKFTAPPNNIVIVTFDNFNIAPKKQRVYDETKNGLINENTSYSGEYCGNQIQPQTSFSSLQNHLLFYVSLKTPSEGFKGTIKFVSKGNFRSDAIDNGGCRYLVNSLEGKLFSPLYPHYFPSKSHCFYELPSITSRKLVLTLEFLELSSVECHLNYVDVFQLEPKILLEKFCYDFQPPYNITSTSGLLVVFHSNVKNSNHSRGFKFFFKYLPLHDGYFEESRPEKPKVYVKYNSSSGCGLEIKSPSITSNERGIQQATGIINSALLFQLQNFPFKCTLIFKGSAEEQVQITFIYFNLFSPQTDVKNEGERCRNADKVSIYVRIGKGMSLIGDFCGNRLPPKIMSTKNYLELTYDVRSTAVNRQLSPSAPYAFTLQYDFRADLGLGGMNGERNASAECYYIFRSSRQKAGNIQSPNYPGLYPRMINCHYVFYGLMKEIVVISFENFDVEGLPTCEDESSDYVLFSNYQTDDRTNRKFCGQLKPTQPIRSESNYFRMTFKSNSMFDGYGFYAHYQFISSETNEQSSDKTPSGVARDILSFAFLLSSSFFMLVFTEQMVFS